MNMLFLHSSVVYGVFCYRMYVVYGEFTRLDESRVQHNWDELGEAFQYIIMMI